MADSSTCDLWTMLWWMSTIRDQSTLKWDTKKANWYKALYGACIVFLSCHSSATKWTLKTNIFKNAAHTCRVWWMWNHPQSFFFLSKPEHLWLLRSYHGGAIMSAINVTLHDVLLWKTTEVIAKILSSYFPIIQQSIFICVQALSGNNSHVLCIGDHRPINCSHHKRPIWIYVT